jgi:ankyrin repeat protein
VNARDDFGTTPLMAAARNGQAEVVAALLINRADVNAQDAYGTTAFAVASEQRLESVAQLLRPVSPDQAQTAGGRVSDAR